MKKLISLLLLAAAQCALALTPAEQSIAQARQAIEKNPRQSEGYNTLALALARRARETSDVAYYAQAEEAAEQSLAVAPGNFGGLKARAWILLGQHEFAKAREVAAELNQRAPDDVLVYGFLTDANVELGNYDEAEKACNWMLKLRPGNVPALTRAAYLREIFGNPTGAIELMKIAYQATPVRETEDRAWILTQIAHLYLTSGKTEDAANVLNQALDSFPDYHYALAGLAKVRTAQHRHEESVQLLRRRYQAAPHAENLYDLAEALEAAGKHEEARAAFVEFETQSLAESEKWDNSNRELIFYYADYAHQPDKALEVAERERARRHDVYTLDAYAWALHVNGRDAEARDAMREALSVGIQDDRLRRHAAEIERSW